MPSLDDYDIGEFLGSGGFASVHRARCRASDEQCAIKVIDKAVMRDHGTLNRVKNEIYLHKTMNHAHIVRLRCHFEDDANIYMVLELCEGGNLFKYLRNTGPMAEEVAGHVTRQILLAVDYLHRSGVVHRDLKLSNVLVSDSGSMDIKLCDFGLAVKLQHPDEEHFTLCGTPNYIAPEIAGQTAYGYPADLWAVGCLFYCMVTGMSPFEQRDVATTLQRILTGHYAKPAYLSSEALDFLQRLLQMDPMKRASAEEISKHPFIAQCSATDEAMTQLANKLAKVAAVGTVAGRRRRIRSGKLDVSISRSSGDDTEQMPWSAVAAGVEGGSRASSHGAIPLLLSASSPDVSMSSSKSSQDVVRSSSGSVRLIKSGDINSSNSIASGSIDIARVESRFLASCQDGGGTTVVQPKQIAEEPLSWRWALSQTGKGKAAGLEDERQSHRMLYANLAVSTSSLNCSVDSNASALFCHSRSVVQSGSDSRPHSNARPLPLLQFPSRQSVMHRSANGDLLLCCAGESIVYCTSVTSKVNAPSIQLRLVIKQCSRTKISICRLDSGMLQEKCRIVEKSCQSSGFLFLKGEDHNEITSSCLVTSTVTDKVYSIKGLPDWAAVKYIKIGRILEAVERRIPKLVMYVSSSSAIQLSTLLSRQEDIKRRLISENNLSSNSLNIYCKCMLMSNEPLPDFCVQWADGVKLRYSLDSGRLHLSSPQDPPNIPLYQWDGSSEESVMAVPSWTTAAPDSVKEYLVVAQNAMYRCLQEQEARGGFNHDSQQEVVVYI